MARVEKGTRIKYLPPKAQLQRRDAHTGSYPANVRLSSDNRTGIYKVFFDDTSAIDFNKETSVVYPTRLPISSSYYLNEPEFRTTMNVTGTPQMGISDKFVSFTPGQYLQPFNDHGNYASDAITNSASNAFYAVGSSLTDIGPGFTQPLWSKSKIDIDLSTAASASFGFNNPNGKDNAMAYYDFVSKTYVPLGISRQYTDYFADADNAPYNWIRDKSIAFAPSLGLVLDQIENNAFVANMGTPIDNFGFPSHQKFCAPSSSMLLSMADKIAEPFLVEKMVLEFSGAWDNGDDDTLIGEGVLNTFFVLNQRSPSFVSQSYRTDEIVDGINFRIGSVHRSGAIDLVNVMQIHSQDAYKVKNPMISSEMDLDASAYYGQWSGRFIMSGTVKSPTKNVGSNYCKLNSFFNGDDLFLAFKNERGGRTGISKVSDRNFIQPTTTTTQLSQQGFGIAGVQFSRNEANWINNPYVLLPTDNLIIGWQAAFPADLNTAGTRRSVLRFPANTEMKLTLYGSTIRNGEEYHDTLNQLLSSNSVFEDIG